LSTAEDAPIPHPAILVGKTRRSLTGDDRARSRDVRERRVVYQTVSRTYKTDSGATWKIARISQIFFARRKSEAARGVAGALLETL